MHLVLLSVVSADSLVAHFVTFIYELILQNSSCGNSVQPGLRINSSKSQVPGAHPCGFRLENLVCSFLALITGRNTGPRSWKGSPGTSNSFPFPSRAKNEADKFSSRLFKSLSFPWGSHFICVCTCVWVGGRFWSDCSLKLCSPLGVPRKMWEHAEASGPTLLPGLCFHFVPSLWKISLPLYKLNPLIQQCVFNCSPDLGVS